MTPPTYSPWLRVFEALGRLNLGGGMTPDGSPGPVGGPQGEIDCEGDISWRALTSPRALFDAWGPPARSPWSGYHRPTLFAAVNGFSRPQDAAPLASQSGRNKPRVGADRAIVLDLPGPVSVALGAWLAARSGYQPVVLANNWPHSNDVVDLGSTLAALLYYAPWATTDRDLRGDRAPPVFILDRSRLGRLPRPGEFDNRYFHTDADFPSAAVLRRNGIGGILYVHPPLGWTMPTPPPPPTLTSQGVATSPSWTPAESPLTGTPVWVPSPDPTAAGPVWRPAPDPPATTAPMARPPAPEPWALMPTKAPDLHVDMDDVHVWLRDGHKQLGLVQSAEWIPGQFGWRAPEPLDTTPRKTVFNTVRDPAFEGFRRSSAGGFGRLVPQPSQGGGYYGGGFG